MSVRTSTSITITITCPVAAGHGRIRTSGAPLIRSQGGLPPDLATVASTEAAFEPLPHLIGLGAYIQQRSPEARLRGM
jgi:hypothetical protein